jgi:hypothetical protein
MVTRLLLYEKKASHPYYTSNDASIHNFLLRSIGYPKINLRGR